MVSFVQKGPLRPEPSSGNINKIYGSRGINVQGGRGAMLDRQLYKKGSDRSMEVN